MQKTIGKLTLSKDTLRNLDDRELDNVAGGQATFCACSSNCTAACSLCTRNCGSACCQ